MMMVHIVATLWIGVLVCAAQAGVVWLDVPFVKQEKNGCGAASIAMVMRYWQHQPGSGVDAPQTAEIQKALYREEVRGIYASELENYLRQHGYKTFAFAGQMKDLAGNLAKGRPLIAGLEPSRGARLHYVVIAGMDAEKRVVLLNDPAERKLLQRDFDTFEKEWGGTGHWTLLAVPSSADEKPAL